MAPIPPSHAEPQDSPESYVGMEVSSARERAQEHGWPTVRALPHGAIITMEYLVGRLNFEVTDGTVTRCWKG
ncbi:proteinase inhibitor I78 [Streptomyces sp. NPDC127066]|uniref:proteinase inhibitor I78 n=1 Tax=Streptomyces sp. NPDC127066 TaxID=3347125 RepID=UPI00365FA2F6